MRYTKQSQIDSLTAENYALRRNIADLKARHDLAIDGLADAAAGYGQVLDGGKVCSMTLAKNKLARIAKMALREAP